MTRTLWRCGPASPRYAAPRGALMPPVFASRRRPLIAPSSQTLCDLMEALRMFALCYSCQIISHAPLTISLPPSLARYLDTYSNSMGRSDSLHYELDFIVTLIIVHICVSISTHTTVVVTKGVA